MKIIITGCAGFIGSHATEEFLSHGYEILGIDSLTYAGNIKNLSVCLINKNFKFLEADIADESIMKFSIDSFDPDWIINFAAETHVDNSIKSVSPFLHSNVLGVASLLNCCKNTKTKFFQISTDEVYGPISKGSFREDDKLNPTNPYSATKASAEHLVTSHSNTFGTQYLIARPSNNFGPRQNKEKFLPNSITQFLQGKKIPVYGKGENLREWTYVKDTAKAVRFLVENGKKNESYNISSSFELKNIETLKILSQILKFQTIFDDQIEFVPDRLGHDFRYSVNCQKLESLGWSFESNFIKNLEETVEFFKENGEIS